MYDAPKVLGNSMSFVGFTYRIINKSKIDISESTPAWVATQKD